MSNLNIYKVSGTAKVGYTGKVYYWLAKTNDLSNTRAMNYVLSELNLANTLLSVEDDVNERIELMNKIDLYTVILEGLFLCKDSTAVSVEGVGTVISNMVLNGAFNSDTDDIVIRTDNLDAIIIDFINKVNNIPSNLDTDAEFDVWYQAAIVDEDYNDTPEYVLKNYQEVAKIGASDDGAMSITQKSSDAGPAFLYMFMTEKQINSCNDTIKKRYNQEIKNWQWETKILRGSMSAETLYNIYKNGCTLHYGMKPEKKIQELFEYNAANGGKKIGDPMSATAIISLVVTIVSVLISLVYLILDVYQITYNADDDYKDGVPDQSADGWSLGDAVVGGDKEDVDVKGKKTLKGSANILIYAGLALTALFAFNKK